MKKLLVTLSGCVFLVGSGTAAFAQGYTPEQLQTLVGPIALYPDPLIAEILPASTFPTEITLADRYVSGGGDPAQIPDQGWDPSVQALAHYGNVLKWMDDNLTWTTQLGQAFQSQEADVSAAIQQLRGQAQNLGNLPTTPQETVSDDNGEIEIDPTDDNQMYVPSYDPGVIYAQPGVYCTFPYFLPIGPWLGYDCDWHNHGLIYWGPGHSRPGDWWHRPPAYRHVYINGHPEPIWHPGGGGVGHGSLDRGYAAHPDNRTFSRAEPPREGPRNNVDVTVIHSAPTTFRNVQPLRTATPAPRVSGGIFEGGGSGREAVESSARGSASRGEIHAAPEAPHVSGGGGGGGAPHGGGFSGGGGGGGSHGGGHH